MMKTRLGWGPGGAIPTCAVVLGLGLQGSGCGGGRDDGFQSSGFPTSVTATATASGTGTSGGTDGSDDGTSGDGPKLDVGMDDETGSMDTSDECAAVSETANVGLQPADIIVVVDNSGSMEAEAGFVQNNMNMFSTQIFLANIDARVVLISAYPDDDAGICINEPLGSGGCPTMDTNEPTFLHIGDGVGSNNGLQKILDHYDSYSHLMRPTASKHLMVVTDDDSDLSAGDFNAAFLALDPSHAGYSFHAIASPEDPVVACAAQTACCPGFFPLSAALSQEYIDLTNMTGGIFGNLCLQDFQPVFDELSTAVISGATLACEYDIPEPPEGEEFNPDEVNVEFDDGMGGTLEIGFVEDPAECAGVTDGWYYDDVANPTKIIVCPQTCDEIQGFDMASIAIKFGCATIPAG